MISSRTQAKQADNMLSPGLVDEKNAQIEAQSPPMSQPVYSRVRCAQDVRMDAARTVAGGGGGENQGLATEHGS